MFDEAKAAIAKFARAKFYPYIDTTENQPNPGAEAAAFNSLMLPIVEWDGSGEPFMYQLYGTFPEVYVNQMVVPTGIAGIQAGQVDADNLNDPMAVGDTSLYPEAT